MFPDRGEFDEVVGGIVDFVTFSPGREDGLLTIDLRGQDAAVLLLADAADSELQVAGEAVTYRELVAWLAANECTAALVLRHDRYDAATRAAFFPR